MGTKNNPGNFDCYHNALPDEPMFILLARDPSAPELVEDWATERQRQIGRGFRPQSDQAMVDEAVQCAANMKHWRVINNGVWRDHAAQPASPLQADEIAEMVRRLRVCNWNQAANLIEWYQTAQPASPLRGREPTEEQIEIACAAYAKATGYYVEFHRGLSSASSDEMRKGMRAALSASPPEQTAADPEDEPGYGGRYGLQRRPNKKTQP